MGDLNQLILAGGPNAYWRLGDAASPFADSSGNGNSMSTQQASVVAQNRNLLTSNFGDNLGNAPRFSTDGATPGGYVQAANSATVSFTGVITIEALIYITTAPGGDAPILESYEAAPNLNGYALRAHFDGVNTVLNAYVLDGAGIAGPAVGATHLQINTVYHVAMTADGSNMRVFVAGVQDGVLATAKLPAASASATCKIGSYGDVFSAGNTLIGNIQECALYHKVLDPTVLRTHYLESRAAGSTTFDYPEGRQAADLTPMRWPKYWWLASVPADVDVASLVADLPGELIEWWPADVGAPFALTARTLPPPLLDPTQLDTPETEWDVVAPDALDEVDVTAFAVDLARESVLLHHREDDILPRKATIE